MVKDNNGSSRPTSRVPLNTPEDPCVDSTGQSVRPIDERSAGVEDPSAQGTRDRHLASSTRPTDTRSLRPKATKRAAVVSTPLSFNISKKSKGKAPLKGPARPKRSRSPSSTATSPPCLPTHSETHPFPTGSRDPRSLGTFTEPRPSPGDGSRPESPTATRYPDSRAVGLSPTHDTQTLHALPNRAGVQPPSWHEERGLSGGGAMARLWWDAHTDHSSGSGPQASGRSDLHPDPRRTTHPARSPPLPLGVQDVGGQAYPAPLLGIVRGPVPPGGGSTSGTMGNLDTVEPSPPPSQPASTRAGGSATLPPPADTSVVHPAVHSPGREPMSLHSRYPPPGDSGYPSLRGNPALGPPQPPFLPGDRWLYAPERDQWLSADTQPDSMFGHMWHPASSRWFDLGPAPSRALSDRRPPPCLPADHRATRDPPQPSTFDQLGRDPPAPLHLPPGPGSSHPPQDSPSLQAEEGVEDFLPHSGDLTLVESWRPLLVTRDNSPVDMELGFSRFVGPPPTRSSRPKLVASQHLTSMWEAPARSARGAPAVPPPGPESLTAPHAIPVGSFLRDPRQGHHVFQLFSDNPVTREISISPDDCRLISNRPPPTSTTVSVKNLVEWDRIARSGLLHTSAGHAFLTMLLERVEELSAQEDGAVSVASDASDSGSQPETASRLFADPLMRFLINQIGHHLTAAAGNAARGHFNCLLAVRDAVLSQSHLSPALKASLRCLPGQDQSLFGDYSTAVITHSVEERKQAASFAFRSPRQARPAGPSFRPTPSTSRSRPYPNKAPKRTARTAKRPSSASRPKPKSPQQNFRFGQQTRPRR